MKPDARTNRDFGRALIHVTRSKRVKVDDITADREPRKLPRLFAMIPLIFLCAVQAVHAQSQYAPIVLTPPPQDAVDENFVSVFTGQVHFSLPALRLGDVSFTPYTTHEQFDPALSSGGT